MGEEVEHSTKDPVILSDEMKIEHLCYNTKCYLWVECRPHYLPYTIHTTNKKKIVFEWTSLDLYPIETE